MEQNDPDELEAFTLDETSARVYQQTLVLGSFDEDALIDQCALRRDQLVAARDTLVRLRLLHADTADPARLRPSNPQVAAAQLTGPAEAMVQRQQRLISQLRSQLVSLMPLYLEGRRAQGTESVIDVVNDPSDIGRMLDAAARDCREDLVTVQPGGARPAETLAEALPRDLAILGSGVHMRVLYQHPARANLHTRSYVRAISEAGAEVRTVDEISQRLLIFDRKVAFVPGPRQAEGVPPAAIVREPNLVAFLYGVFEQMWSGATPFEVEAEGYDGVSDQLRLSILRLMATGAKDEVVARKLGMSLRTCRRHISNIMRDMGAESRFQAGALAMRSRFLDDGDDRDAFAL
ncbi:LuxR family transcriptional regulator [Streptomyces filipinensis]|uniref:LuxR family transcriptional regulator n=1 Tax=Streptomyces filipinensis TaxID=66887 RepID=A0A918MBR6_9ACTN|nr:helix-turn-helix transcriptional regulator [Streptomyces filipinensis]GGV02315.1 LuxR family transcriptional regulator [Streptomyces filipinensis]